MHALGSCGLPRTYKSADCILVRQYRLSYFDTSQRQRAASPASPASEVSRKVTPPERDESQNIVRVGSSKIISSDNSSCLFLSLSPSLGARTILVTSQSTPAFHHSYRKVSTCLDFVETPEFRRIFEWRIFSHRGPPFKGLLPPAGLSTSGSLVHRFEENVRECGKCEATLSLRNSTSACA